MSYNAPLDDILHTIRHIAGFDGDPALWGEGLSVEDLSPILSEAASFAADRLAPLNRQGDLIGALWADTNVTLPTGWRQTYQDWIAAGWNATAQPEEFGGTGLPTFMGTASMEMITSACMALSTLPVLTQGAADALEAHGSEALKALYLPKMVSGEWTGTMNLTEPQAGSDLGLMRSRAEPAGDGTYRIFGQKIFITYGEHDLADNIIHLVLARLPDAPPGTKGISLFLVPKFLLNPDGSLGARNDVRCTGIEHKLGIKSSPTCSMSFGDQGGAIGWLIGEPNKGLACMFTMMNKARLATGLQGVSICERAWQQGRAYAAERRQGRAPGVAGTATIDNHPDVQRMLVRMRALTLACRALAYQAAGSIDRAARAQDPAIRAQAELQAGLLTPVVKSFCTDSGVEVASLNIQIHGGMGFVEETGAAQHLRDIRIAPIYEGTNAIQAIDLTLRKLGRPDGVATLTSWIEDAKGWATDHPLLLAALDDLSAATAWMTTTNRAESDKLFVAGTYLRLVALAFGGALLAKGAAAPGAPSYWAPCARLFAEDIASESPSLLASIRSSGRQAGDYAAAIAV